MASASEIRPVPVLAYWVQEGVAGLLAAVVAGIAVFTTAGDLRMSGPSG